MGSIQKLPRNECVFTFRHSNVELLFELFLKHQFKLIFSNHQIPELPHSPGRRINECSFSQRPLPFNYSPQIAASLEPQNQKNFSIARRTFKNVNQFATVNRTTRLVRKIYLKSKACCEYTVTIQHQIAKRIWDTSCEGPLQTIGTKSLRNRFDRNDQIYQRGVAKILLKTLNFISRSYENPKL